MEVKKLLIVPSERIIAKQANESVLIKIAKGLKSKIRPGQLQYDGEMQFYGDMPLVLGKENVYVFGQYHKHYFSKTVSDECPYPSCCLTPESTFVSEGQLDSIFNDIDAVLVSSRANERAEIAIQKARAKSVPVAIIDFADHESNYGSEDIAKEICRGFIYGKDFDLYFKKDLPLGYKTETILPLCPIPIRPQSYEFREVVQEVDIFYSGRKRLERCQPERSEVVDFVRENFNNSLILEHDIRNSFMSIREYWANLDKSKIALSPSGRVWDSFRYCEVALTESTVLLAPKPYVETVAPYLEDGNNAILYDTELKDGRYHLKDSNDLVEKIKHYLNNSTELEKIAKAWRRDVLAGHTIAARSKYIIDCIAKLS
ncbi:glycosyltransferase family 1 protein [bacterium]|nr:glycosyltransferase family 1 protein [bacterium]